MKADEHKAMGTVGRGPVICTLNWLIAHSLLTMLGAIVGPSAVAFATNCEDSYGNPTTCDVYPVPNAPESVWPQWMPGAGNPADHCSVDCGDPTNPNSPFWSPGM